MIENLYEGDERMESLLQALKAEIYDRTEGVPIPSIIGVLEILKLEIIKEQTNE
jgi:hypothetical protein